MRPLSLSLLTRAPAFLTFPSEGFKVGLIRQQYDSSASGSNLEASVNTRTAILIAAVGVILSLCLGVAGGAAAGYFVMQTGGRGFARGGLFTPNLIPNQLGPQTFGNGLAQGALVTLVESGSPADKAGLKAGDLITAIDGQTIDATHSLSTLLTQKKPGENATLTIRRNGQQQTVTVTLGSNPSNSTAAYLGIQFATPRMRNIAPGQSS